MRHILKLSLVALLLVHVSANAQRAPSAKPFERFDGCTILPDPSNDGDSFRVRLPDGREQTFRLYFVDCPEASPSGSRSNEQALYFGHDRASAVAVGQEATVFSARALAGRFTIFTRWRPVFNAQRYFAVVMTSEGKDLAELVVMNGLARIYGTRTPLPDGRDSRTYLSTLAELETKAKMVGIGGWRRP